MKKILYLISILSLASCAKVDKLTLKVKKADYKKCQFTFTGGGNHFKLKGNYPYSVGDKFKLEQTDQDSGVVFKVWLNSPWENFTEYSAKFGKANINFTDTIYWDFDSKFKLVKIND